MPCACLVNMGLTEADFLAVSTFVVFPLQKKTLHFGERNGNLQVSLKCGDYKIVLCL